MAENIDPPTDVVDDNDLSQRLGDPSVVGFGRGVGGITVAMRQWMQGVSETLLALEAAIAALPTSMIASIQYGTITIGTGSASNTAAISSVDTAKTALHFLGQTTNAVVGEDPEKYTARITLTSATVVTATRNAGDATTTVTVSFCVVEYL